MVDKFSSYISPFETRYASPEMKYNFSDKKRFITWRKMWLYLASCEKKLGLDISDEQIQQLQNNIENIDFQKAAEEEKKTRHDVMAHIHVFAEQCPLAAPIIHLGATSCDIVDNADLIILKNGFEILLPKIVQCIKLISQFAENTKDQPTLGFTHLQPAQLTTVGKRACLWLQELLISEEAIVDAKKKLKFRGIKGTTGTQASFLRLFNGDYEKVKQLDKLVTQEANFQESYPITGQTYPRLVDVTVVSALAIFGAALHKMCTDLRLLASLNEISEPIEETQIGSSAMAYKQNPMRSERCCSISRYLMNLVNNPLNTAAVQWFERTLDDSANRRLTLSEAFLAADSVVRIVQNIFQGIRIYPEVINRHIQEEMPFMATENIIIAVVKHGGDRQVCHEKIRTMSAEVKTEIKENGYENRLIEKIKTDPYFKNILHELPSILDATTFVGCASLQVTEYIENYVQPVLKKYSNISDGSFVTLNL